MEALFESPDTKKNLQRIIRTKFRGGRRIPAVVFDSAFMGLILFAASYITVRPHIKNTAVSVAVSLFVFAGTVCVLIVIRRERFLRYERRLKREALEDVLRMKLMLDPERLLSLVHETSSVFVFRGTDTIGSDDIRAAVCNKGLPVTIVSEALPTKTAAEMIKLSGGRVKLVNAEEHLGIALSEVYSVAPGEIEDAIIAKHSDSIKKISFSKDVFRLTKDRAVRYLGVGAGLFALSFVMRYTLYFRLMASLCMSLGAGFFAAEEIKKRAAED